MSNIEWTGATWNPILGCSKISAGCQRCYAIDQAYRNWAMAMAMPKEKRGRLAYYQGLSHDGISKDWTGELVFVPEALEIPLKRKKPQTYFVNSMSDMFHDKVEEEWLDQIFEVMEQTPQHTYQVLTKRPRNMLLYIGSKYLNPLKNVWLGATLENQKAVDSRAEYISSLHDSTWTTFYSCEPLLEEIILDLHNFPVSWVIVGGESGGGARECQLSWIESVVSQCQSADVPVFVKQLGANAIAPDGSRLKLGDRKGGNIEEFPIELQVREFPQKIAPD